MANSCPALRSTKIGAALPKFNGLPEHHASANLHVPALHHILPQGLKRGHITELYGRRSSGRSSICLPVLAEATAQGEICAVVDLFGGFHPAAASLTGVCLNRLIWVRCCGNMESAFRATDLLLHAGGFGVIILDFCESSPRALNRIPISYWYRFRKTIEHTSTVLLVCGDSSPVKLSSASKLETKLKAAVWSGKEPFPLLSGLEICTTLDKVSVLRSNPLFLQKGA
jgi:hypothetical protein